MIARVEGVLITFYVKPLEFQSLRMSKSQPRQFPIFAWEASPRIQIQGSPNGHGLHFVDIELTCAALSKIQFDLAVLSHRQLG